jgi:hypothetical protein
MSHASGRGPLTSRPLPSPLLPARRPDVPGPPAAGGRLQETVKRVRAPPALFSNCFLLHARPLARRSPVRVLHRLPAQDHGQPPMDEAARRVLRHYAAHVASLVIQFLPARSCAAGLKALSFLRRSSSSPASSSWGGRSSRRGHEFSRAGDARDAVEGALTRRCPRGPAQRAGLSGASSGRRQAAGGPYRGVMLVVSIRWLFML